MLDEDTFAPKSGEISFYAKVIETGGDNEATDTVAAKWTGVTFVSGVANEQLRNTPADASYTVGLFGNGVPCFVDRNHTFVHASDTVLMPKG